MSFFLASKAVRKYRRPGQKMSVVSGERKDFDQFYPPPPSQKMGWGSADEIDSGIKQYKQ